MVAIFDVQLLPLRIINQTNDGEIGRGLSINDVIPEFLRDVDHLHYIIIQFSSVICECFLFHNRISDLTYKYKNKLYTTFLQ